MIGRCGLRENSHISIKSRTTAAAMLRIGIALKMKRSSLCGRIEKSARYATIGHTNFQTLVSRMGAALNAARSSLHEELLTIAGSSELHATHSTLNELSQLHVTEVLGCSSFLPDSEWDQ